MTGPAWARLVNGRRSLARWGHARLTFRHRVFCLEVLGSESATCWTPSGRSALPSHRQVPAHLSHTDLCRGDTPAGRALFHSGCPGICFHNVRSQRRLSSCQNLVQFLCKVRYESHQSVSWVWASPRDAPSLLPRASALVLGLFMGKGKNWQVALSSPRRSLLPAPRTWRRKLLAGGQTPLQSLLCHLLSRAFKKAHLSQERSEPDYVAEQSSSENRSCSSDFFLKAGWHLLPINNIFQRSSRGHPGITRAKGDRQGSLSAFLLKRPSQESSTQWPLSPTTLPFLP